MTASQIDRARLDLFDVYSTIETLRGARRQPGAPFEFLFAKAPYNWMQDQVESAPVALPGTHPVPLRVGSVCGGPLALKNFWRGAGPSPRVHAYTGYLGGQRVSQVAWDFLVPFSLQAPVTVSPDAAATGPAGPATAQVLLWPCGWGVRLRLEVQASGPLDRFASRMLKLQEEKLEVAIGAEQTVGSPAAVLAWISDWVRRHVVLPVFAAALPAPTRFGPFTFVTVRRGSGVVADGTLDAASQRLIYAATTQHQLWESYALDKIQAGFKHIDTYPGSFIFMDRMARLVWFPSLMGRRPRAALDCYVENTLAAMMMMAALSEFVRLVTAQLDSATLRMNYPLRTLYQNAAKRLADFPAAYQNTNLKRLAADLGVARRVAEAATYLA